MKIHVSVLLIVLLMTSFMTQSLSEVITYKWFDKVSIDGMASGRLVHRTKGKSSIVNCATECAKQEAVPCESFQVIRGVCYFFGGRPREVRISGLRSEEKTAYNMLLSPRKRKQSRKCSTHLGFHYVTTSSEVYCLAEYTYPLQFTSTRSICDIVNGSVAILDKEEKIRKAVTQLYQDHKARSIWVGVRYHITSDTFRSLTGDAVIYKNDSLWASGKPEHPASRECVTVKVDPDATSSALQFNTESCSDPKHFLCEIFDFY